MSFQQGLSGLSAASAELDSVGNNIANSSTVGYKSSDVQFADVYASSLNGSAGAAVGIGVAVGAIAQEFSQGNVTTTDNPMDIAINGDGFFVMSDQGTVCYSRDGQFSIDDEGYIVNSTGCNLTGYSADLAGNISDGATTNLQIQTADLSPNATTEVDTLVNLNSNEDAINVTTHPFDPTDILSFNHSTACSVYDSLGNSHILQTYYVKTDSNEWNVYAITDVDAYEADPSNGFGLVGNLEFDENGVIDVTQSSNPFSVGVVSNTGATSPTNFTMDFTGTTQFGAEFSVKSLVQDGYTSGSITGFTFAADGTIVGTYSNGESNVLGQVVVASFTNNNGLAPIGNNLWIETASSGQPLVGEPTSGSLGTLVSSAVEDSNVDLTEELVNMITAQRYYEANSQTIKTQDDIMQTLVNLR